MRAGKRGNFAHDFTSTARTMILTQRAACAKPLAYDAPRHISMSYDAIEGQPVVAEAPASNTRKHLPYVLLTIALMGGASIAA